MALRRWSGWNTTSNTTAVIPLESPSRVTRREHTLRRCWRLITPTSRISMYLPNRFAPLWGYLARTILRQGQGWPRYLLVLTANYGIRPTRFVPMLRPHCLFMAATIASSNQAIAEISAIDFERSAARSGYISTGHWDTLDRWDCYSY